ncbi:hypothetical protein UlMin_008370 [Ulmus minor]
MERRSHVLVIGYPAQGHVGPLIKLSQQIADQGIKVTFISEECIYDLLLATFSEKNQQNLMEIVSISDGVFEQENGYKDTRNIKESMSTVMPRNFEKLIKKMNGREDEKITCVIADATTAWALEIAEKMGIKTAMFWPSSVRGFVLGHQIQKLIEAGIIDENGAPLKNETIQISPNISGINTSELIWRVPGDPIRQNIIFGYVHSSNRAIKISNWLLCNSFYELDPLACDLIPNLLPIGPLLSSKFPGKSAGNLCKEDSTCLSWLDKQPEKSVIYVAFGSITILSQHQCEELARGLDLTGKPFLWVVRSDLINGSKFEYPERAMDRGKIVKWAPQEKVLAHRSVACFLSHCGWNSTMEGISMGVPFLCWPYFADQFHIRSYVCDVLKVGLGLDVEQNGIISRNEIKRKIGELLSHTRIRENTLKLKEMAEKSVNEGGSSFKNLASFVEQIKST